MAAPPPGGCGRSTGVFGFPQDRPATGLRPSQLRTGLNWTETHFNPELFCRSATNVVHRVSEEAYRGRRSPTQNIKSKDRRLAIIKLDGKLI